MTTTPGAMRPLRLRVVCALNSCSIMSREDNARHRGLALGALFGNFVALGVAIGLAGFTVALRKGKEALTARSMTNTHLPVAKATFWHYPTMS
jgi:hypothetical protein